LDPVEARLRKVFATVFEVEEEEITDESSPETVVLWDSLRHLAMITEIEAAFHIRLTMKEIRSMVTFARIREVVAAYGKEAATASLKGDGIGRQ
jgi:acyl carrier protein